jgi:hypothetical protein
MTWWLWLGLVISLVALAALGAAAYGSKRWADTTRALSCRLDAGRIGPTGRECFDSRELDGLPAPVQRYFRTVLQDGQPIIAAASIKLAGIINLSASKAQWQPFRSGQRVVTSRPGFLWVAKVTLLPGLLVRVIDSYVAGEGRLHAAIQGLFTVAEARGGGELARGELMRFFAEAAWYPTALLPSQGVRWQAVDASSANATLVDGPLSLTLLFRFNDAGLIDSFRAEARGAGVGKAMVMTPWEGRWSDYREHHGMILPFYGEVAWMQPEGRKTYFRGKVTAVNYEFWT